MALGGVKVSAPLATYRMHRRRTLLAGNPATNAQNVNMFVDNNPESRLL